MIINKNKQSGIALITTIILTSIMLSSVVLITKEMVDEVKNSTRLDNSLIAYYAAEAGLEDALLEFRYDHDAEISESHDKTGVDVTATSGNVPRTVNITAGGPPIDNSTIKNYNESYYELTMWDKVPCLIAPVPPANLNPNGCAVIPPLKADDVYEFSIDDIGGNTVTLGFAPRNGLLNDELGNGYRIEITVLDENGNILPPPTKRFTCPDAVTQTISFNSSSLNGTTGKRIFRVKPWYTQYSSDCNNPPDGAVSKPAEDPYIHLSVNKTPNAQLISGPVTNIESVGFFGGVQRKIVASIDQTSGEIIGIFDYVIYSGGDLIK